MKKFSLVFSLAFLVAGFALAQRTVVGQISDNDGSPLIGASVFAKGTDSGTVTDIDGKYSIDVPQGANILEFSYTGYETQEIELGASNVVNIELSAGITLQDIVVTALGVERERKELGYSVTTVDGDDMTKVRASNALEALSGRVAGVRTNAASGTAGGSVNVLIRGANSLGGGNDPLFVVDGAPISNSSFNGTRNQIIGGGADVGNRASDINPDDIESISVLKGASAVALYGQRARDGVIVIKTKRAKKSGVSVDVNTSYRISNPLRLPEFQNEYASGDFGTYDAANFVNGWGPRISDVQGQTFQHFPFTEEKALVAQPDNVKDFFDTGNTFVNNFAVSTKGDNGDIRISHTYLNENSFIPGNKFRRNNVSLNAGTSFTEKLSARGIINYARSQGFNRPRQGSNNPSVLLSRVYGLTRTMDIDDLRNNIRDDKGNAIGIDGNGTSNNPFWILENNPFNNTVDRVYGSVELNYQLLPWLSLKGRAGNDFYTETRRNISAKGTLGNINGSFEDRDLYRRELNTDLILSANKQLNSDFELNALVGWNTNEIFNERIRIEASDLLADGVYNPANALSVANQRFESKRRLIGGYADVGIGYRGFLYVNVTGRNDWSSTLPKSNRSFFYPGISSSFIFSDAFNLDDSVLKYGKIRASYAQVGSDEVPYQLDFLYTPASTVFTQFVADNTYPIGGQAVFEGPLTLPAGQNLEPQKQNTFEIGTELQFFDGRLGFDLTYYNTVTSNQILSVAVPQSTGFEAIRQNVGEVSNVGFEALVNFTPVKTKDLMWDVFVNFSQNQQTVQQLAEGLDDLALTSGFSGLSIRAEEGEEFGLYGSGWDRSPDGDILIDDATGLREPGDRVRLGDIYPDYQVGIGTSLGYKGVSLSALVDISVGGVMYSNTVSGLRGSGLAVETLENRDGIFVDEGVNEIVDADGNSTYVTNTTPVRSMQDFWGNYTSSSNTEGSIFGADYAKLRELTISYSLPKSMFKNSGIGGLSIGIEGRNLWLINSEVPHVDPEASFFGPSLIGGGANIDFWSIPSARSIGMNLKIQF